MTMGFWPGIAEERTVIVIVKDKKIAGTPAPSSSAFFFLFFLCVLGCVVRKSVCVLCLHAHNFLCPDVAHRHHIIKKSVFNIRDGSFGP